MVVVDVVIAMQLDELHDEPVFPSVERMVKLTMSMTARSSMKMSFGM